MANYTNIPAASGGGLSPIANNTVLGNTSGGSAIPTAQTSANLIAGGIIQDPTNVAITGGSITGVNTATTSIQGAMSAADKTNVNGQRLLANWYQDTANVMAAQVAALTRYRAMRPPSGSIDAAVDGGGVTPGAGLFSFWGDGLNVIQNLSTAPWAVGWRAKLASAAVAGHDAEVGICRVAAPRYWVSIFANNANSSTNYCLQLFSAGGTDTPATSLADDAGWHTFVLTFDLTTVKAIIDGNVVATQSNLTHLTSVAAQPYVFNSVQGDTVAIDCLVGFVGS